MRQRKLEPRIRSQSPVPEKENRSAATSILIDGQWFELHDAQLPREMDGNGRAELSNV